MATYRNFILRETFLCLHLGSPRVGGGGGGIGGGSTAFEPHQLIVWRDHLNGTKVFRVGEDLKMRIGVLPGFESSFTYPLIKLVL